MPDKLSIELIREAREFLAQNLTVAAMEALEWDKTGLLPNGAMRQAAAMIGQVILPPGDTGLSLKTIRGMVDALCVEKVATMQLAPQEEIDLPAPG